MSVCVRERNREIHKKAKFDKIDFGLVLLTFESGKRYCYYLVSPGYHRFCSGGSIVSFSRLKLLPNKVSIRFQSNKSDEAFGLINQRTNLDESECS